MTHPHNQRPEGTPPGTEAGRAPANIAPLIEVDHSTQPLSDLTDDEGDLLRIVGELQTEDTHPSTKEVGQRILAHKRERGGPYSFHGSAPWWGTRDAARALQEAGLLEVHYPAATFHYRDEPSRTADRYWLEATPAGLALLAADGR